MHANITISVHVLFISHSKTNVCFQSDLEKAICNLTDLICIALCLEICIAFLCYKHRRKTLLAQTEGLSQSKMGTSLWKSALQCKSRGKAAQFMGTARTKDSTFNTPATLLKDSQMDSHVKAVSRNIKKDNADLDDYIKVNFICSFLTRTGLGRRLNHSPDHYWLKPELNTGTTFTYNCTGTKPKH